MMTLTGHYHHCPIQLLITVSVQAALLTPRQTAPCDVRFGTAPEAGLL